MNLKIIFPLLIFVFLASNVYAVPQTTYQFDAATYRPGSSGTITVNVFNNEGSAEKDFKICFTQTQYILPTNCDSNTIAISYLNTGETKTATINFNILNEAPTPNAYPIKIYLTYSYSTLIGFLPATGYINPSVSVSGISIKDEANQKITQVGTAVSSAQNAITNAQTSITTAQNMITTSQQGNKDVSNANSYLSSAQSDLSSAQSYFSNAQNEYSQAQSLYAATSYPNSLNTINQASSDANNAASYASNANQAALQAQTAATNAECVSGYTLQAGRCVQIPKSTPSASASQNTPSDLTQNTPANSDASSGTQSSSILWIILIIAVIGAVYVLTKKKPEHKKHKSENKK